MPSDLNTKMLATMLSGGDNSRAINTNPGGGPILVPQQVQRLSVGVPALNSSRAYGGGTWVDGMTRLVDLLVSAMVARQAIDDAKAEQRSSAEIGAAGLQMMRGRPAEARTYADPDGGDPTTINWNEQKPNVAAGLDYMMASPTLAPKALAMALALQEGQAKAQTEKDVSAFKEGFRYDPNSGSVSILSGGWGDPGYQGRMSYAKSSGEAAGKFPYDTAEATHRTQLEVWKGNEQPFTLTPGDTRFAGPGNAAPTAPSPLMMGAGPATAAPAASGTMTVPKAPAAAPTGPVPMSPQARATIGVESGGDVDATNPNSSATGPAQFIDSTWLSMMQKHAPGLIQGKSKDEILAMRSDPELASTMTDAYAKENDAALRSSGLEPTPQDLYLAHVFGPGGATTMLKADQRAPAANLNSRGVVEANRSLFFKKNGRPRTVAELRQLLGDRFNRNMPQETVAADPVAEDMATGLADPVRALPPGSEVVPDAPAVGQPQQVGPQPVQVAQASTGTMTDAAPIGIPTAQPNAPRMVAQGGPRPNANFDKLKADTVGNWQAGAEQGATTLNLINQMQDVLDRGFTPGAGAQNMATAARVMQGVGVPADIVSSFYNPADAKAFENASNQMVLSIVKGLGPNPSNADRDFIERTVSLLRDTPEAIREVMGRIRERAAANVAKFRLGYEHSKAGGDPLEFDTQWNTRQTKSLDGQTYYKIGGKWYAAGN